MSGEGISLGEAIESIKVDLGLPEDLRGKAAVEAAQEDLGLEDGGGTLRCRIPPPAFVMLPTFPQPTLKPTSITHSRSPARGITKTISDCCKIQGRDFSYLH
jgi:hypothetical protein